MAVEIPVYIDIDKAFADAAKRVPGASANLRKAIDDLNKDLELFRGKLNSYSAGSKNFELAAKNVMKLEEALDLVNAKVSEFTTRTGSVKRLSGDLRVIQQQFERMGESQMFDSSGKLSADAKKLQADYARVAQHLDRVRAILTEEYEAQVKSRQESEKAAKIAKERYDAISGYTNTLDSLNARLAALRAEIAKVNMYTDPAAFKSYAEAIEFTVQRISRLNEQQKFLGAKSGSIDQMSSKLQALSAEYNSLAEGQRKYGDRAKEIKKEYIEITKELEKESGALQKAARLEIEREASARKKSNTLKAENAILATTQKTMRGLQEQERILSDRLIRTEIGSSKYKQIQRDLASVRLEIEKATGSVSKMNSAFGSQSIALRNLTTMASTYLSVFGALRLVKQIRDVTGELEYQRISLGHLLQDVERGNYLFERIKEAAIESPFRIKDLVTYTKQLAAYRIEQENLFDTTRRLADISAGLGVDMNRLILAFGQVRAASVLRGQELRQFTEAGIPLVELLADKFTELNGVSTSTADVFKLISERAVPFSMIADIFEDLTEKGGMFYKMQEKQAETLKGRWEKLKDAYDIALQSIGDTSTFQRENDIVIGTLRFLAENMRLVVKIADAATISWAAYNAVMLITGRQVNAVVSAEKAAAIAEAVRSKNISGIIVKIMGQAAAEKALTVAMTQATAGTNALSRALGRLKVALLTNPWLVAGAAILSVVLALSRFKESAKDATDAVNALNRSVDDVHAANKHHERVERLINQYEKLSKETERTSVQNDILANTTKKLSDEFPEFSKRLEDQNLSLEQRLTLVKELNAEEEKRIRAIKDQKEQELASYTTRLEDAIAERDEKKAAKESATIYYNTLKAELKKRQAAGEKGRDWFSGFLRGENEFTMFERFVEKVEEELAQAEKAYTEAEGVVSSFESSIRSLRKELYGADTSIDEKTKAWKERLKELQVSSGGVQLFTPEQLEGWHRLYDVSKDLEKEWKKLAVDEKALAAGAEDAKKKGGTYLAQWLQDLSAVRDKKAGLELIRDTFEFIWGKKAKGSDTRLSNLKKDISEITNAYKKFLELRKYMSDSQSLSEIGILFPQLKGWEPSFEKTIEKLQDMRKKVVAQLAKSPNDKTLLEMQRTLDTEISNLKFDDLKKKFDSELKRIKDEIKRSETAHNFYQDILGLTGDEQLAASMSISVYGSVGQDFKDRIKKELVDSLNSLDKESLSGLDEAMRKAFDAGDYEYLAKNIKKVPKAIRATVQQVAADAEKYNADWLKNIVKTYQKTKTYEERISDVRKKEAQNRKEITESETMPQDQKDTFIAASLKKEAEDVAAIEVEALKNSYEWGKAFEDLNRIGSTTLDSLRQKIEDIINAQKGFLTPERLKALTEALDKIRGEQTKRDPLQAISYGAQRALLIAPALRSKEGTDAYKDAIEKIKEFNKNAKETEKIDIGHLEDEFHNANKELEDGIEAVGDYVNAWKSVVDTVTDAFDLDEVPVLGETLQGVSDALSFVAGILPVIITLNGVLNGTLMLNPIIAAGAAIVATIGAIVGLIKGLVNAKVERLNKKIEDQQKLIDNLERSYQKLSDAMDETFDNEYLYNYRKQLEIINAEVAAYRAQADAEQSKGKKADSDKTEEYEQSATDAMERIKEITKEMQSFFAGSDLASAAQDFSSAWLDAYREFGNTAGAIEDRMEEMVKNLVEKAALSGIVQNIMGGWYESLKNIKDWNAQAIAEKVAEARALIPIINQGLNNAAAEFQAAGLSLRGTVGQFTGISRDYAAASEESINGLAAGVNTQNFFLQHLDMNVALILSALTGGASTAGASVTGEVVDPYKDQMLLYAGHLPAMDQNLAELLAEVRKVIKPRGTTATHYVATNM